MKKFTTVLTFLLLASTLFMACQKELSLEGTGLTGTAEGILTDIAGACQDAEIRGDYVVDQALNDSNYAIIDVNFTKQGKYVIFTDTVNGVWFIDSGFALTTGPSKVKIKAYGKPILPNTVDFSLSFGSSLCSFPLTATLTGSTGTNNDYFPNTINSYWTYNFIPGTPTDTFRVTALDQTVLADNMIFRVFNMAPYNSPYYFAKDGMGNYYAHSTTDFDYTYIFDETPNQFLTYIFLKDNEPVGHTWETPQYGKVKLNGQEGVSKAVFAIMGKNVSHTVPGTIYNNVIVVKRTVLFKADTESTFATVLEGNSYYAKGYGLIDQVLVAPNGSQSMSVSKKEIF